MKIEATPVMKLQLTDLGQYKLDPITVIVQDFGPAMPGESSNRCSILIECWGKSWSAKWSFAAGNVARFFQVADDDYLVKCLEPEIEEQRFTGSGLVKHARNKIIQRRRGRASGPLTKAAARTLYQEVGVFEAVNSVEQAYLVGNGLLLDEVFGPSAWSEVAQGMEVNGDYRYLTRIVRAVRDGLALAEAPQTKFLEPHYL